MKHTIPFVAAFSAAAAVGQTLLDVTSADTLGSSGRLCDCHSTCRGAELVYYCGTDEEDVWSNPCLAAEFADLPFCDSALDVTARVTDILSRIPDHEKLGSAGTSTPLSNYATSLPSVGIRYSQWWSEALHGVAISPGVLFNPDTPYATSFPQIISTSHSFNRTLFAAIGAAIGTEIRAFYNLGHAGLTYWTPNLNIFRDPRWGRGQETPGEDPYLTSEYVSSYVPALQYDSQVDPDHLRVSACCKHFVAYSLENYEGMDRHHFDANVTAMDMADTYFPAFEACASPHLGAGSCLMCSYNDVNGVPTCANKDLLTTLARDTWNFDGYITSDCGAVEDIYNTHHFAETPDRAVYDALQAGMDTECGKWFDLHLNHSVQSGLVTMDMVDRALSNLLAIHFRLGRFDKKGTGFDGLDWSAVSSAAHQELAREAARQAVVLLKNDNEALPFSSETISSIAVIGPNANIGKTMQGNYEGHAPYLVTPLDAVKAAVGEDKVTFAQGCDIDSDSTDGFNAAAEAAVSCDVILLVVGIDQSQEREGHDRTSIALPGVQSEMIESVLMAAAGKPVALAVMAGGAVCLDRFKDDPRVSSILFVGYPGQSGGTGLSDVVFGAYNPSGRLTQTFYRAPYVDEVSFFDMSMRAGPSSPGRGYRFYTGESVVYPFGSGMSFTQFDYRWAGDIDVQRKGNRILVSIQVDVTNVGSKHAGAEVVLLFLQPPAESPDSAPIKMLRQFDKAFLSPQESQTMGFQLTRDDFSLADESGAFYVVSGEWTVLIGALSAAVVIPGE